MGHAVLSIDDPVAALLEPDPELDVLADGLVEVLLVEPAHLEECSRRQADVAGPEEGPVVSLSPCRSAGKLKSRGEFSSRRTKGDSARPRRNGRSPSRPRRSPTSACARRWDSTRSGAGIASSLRISTSLARQRARPAFRAAAGPPLGWRSTTVLNGSAPSSIETGGSPPSSTTISSNRWGSRVRPARAETRLARILRPPVAGNEEGDRGASGGLGCDVVHGLDRSCGPIEGPTRSGPRRLRPNGRPRHGPAGAIRSRGSGRNDIPL